MLNFNLFGIPLVGADVCGFAGSRSGGGATGIDGAPMADWAVDAELCTRWVSAGSLLYSFFRVHTMAGRPHQHPGVFPEDPWRAAQRAAVALRYELVPYLYTLHAEAARGGAMPLRSMGIEFAAAAASVPGRSAPASLRSMAEQAMLGPALLVAPALRPGISSVRAYVPPWEVWYDLRDGRRTRGDAEGWAILAAPLTAPPPVLLRGGHVLPSLLPGVGAGRGGARATTNDAPGVLTLTVALPPLPESQGATANIGGAAGSLFWDDGESLDAGTGLWYALAAGQEVMGAREGEEGADPRSDRRGWLNVTHVGGGGGGGGYAAPLCVQSVQVLGASGLADPNPDVAGLADLQDQSMGSTPLAFHCTITVLPVPGVAGEPTPSCALDAALDSLSIDLGACLTLRVGESGAALSVSWELLEDHRAGEL